MHWAGWRRTGELSDYWYLFGFVVFLKFGIDWLGVHSCTPDLGVGAVVLLAAGIVYRLGKEGSGTVAPALILGLVLGVGYYVKAAMFPLSAFLLLMLLCVPPPRVSRGFIVLAALTFSFVAAPLVVLESRSAGRLTFSESGRLNYAWWVNGIRAMHHGGPVDPRAHFIHPPRRLTEHPVTLEFGTPVPATYPLWFDPSYWSQGMQATFNLKQQIAALGVTLTTYIEMFMQVSVLIASAILFFATSPRHTLKLTRHNFWMVAWPLSALALFAPVHVEARYVAGFMILFWIGILSIGLHSTRIVSRGAVVAIVGITLMIPPAFRLALAGGRSVSAFLHPMPTLEVTAARALRNLGLHEGDGILVVGETFEPYYAWNRRLKSRRAGTGSR